MTDEKMKKKYITHYWDEEIHDTACGYLGNNDAVTHIESLVNCGKCKKIEGIN